MEDIQKPDFLRELQIEVSLHCYFWAWGDVQSNKLEKKMFFVPVIVVIPSEGEFPVWTCAYNRVFGRPRGVLVLSLWHTTVILNTFVSHISIWFSFVNVAPFPESTTFTIFIGSVEPVSHVILSWSQYLLLFFSLSICHLVQLLSGCLSHRRTICQGFYVLAA